MERYRYESQRRMHEWMDRIRERENRNEKANAIISIA